VKIGDGETIQYSYWMVPLIIQAQKLDIAAYLDIKIVFSAPYSYDTAPCELLYAHFKNTDINSSRMPTGKRYV